MAILNSTPQPTDFSTQEYQHLIEKYLTLSRENDQLVKAIRSGNQVDIDQVRRVIQTDFPLYVRLQDYFSRLRAEDLESVDQIPFAPDDHVLGSIGVPSRSIDVGMEGDSEMQLVSESDVDVTSMFFGAEGGALTKRPPAVPNQEPFGIRFSDYPPRVISQMLSTHTDVAASSCRWFPSIALHISPHHSLSLMAGVIHVGWFRACQPSEEIHEGTNVGSGCRWERSVRQRSCRKLPVHPKIHSNRRAHTWPQDMILLPSGVKRVKDTALQEWLKRYDPMWCQFVPHHSKGGDDAVMNDLVCRQLIQQLIDQCLVSHPTLLLP